MSVSCIVYRQSCLVAGDFFCYLALALPLPSPLTLPFFWLPAL